MILGELLILSSEDCLLQNCESHKKVSDFVIAPGSVIMMLVQRTQSMLLPNHH